MQIEYKLDAQDIVKINKHQTAMMRRIYTEDTSFWVKLLWSVLLFLWGVPTMLFVVNLPKGMGYWLLYVVSIPAIFSAFLMWFGKRKYYRFVESALLPDTPYTITITEHGLIATSGDSNTSISWSNIKEIVEAPEYIMFVFPLLAVTAIPTRAFSDNNQLAAFISEVHIKMINATALNNAMQRIAEKIGSR